MPTHSYFTLFILKKASQFFSENTSQFNKRLLICVVFSSPIQRIFFHGIPYHSVDLKKKVLKMNQIALCTCLCLFCVDENRQLNFRPCLYKYKCQLQNYKHNTNFGNNYKIEERIDIFNRSNIRVFTVCTQFSRGCVSSYCSAASKHFGFVLRLQNQKAFQFQHFMALFCSNSVSVCSLVLFRSSVGL